MNKAAMLLALAVLLAGFVGYRQLKSKAAAPATQDHGVQVPQSDTGNVFFDLVPADAPPGSAAWLATYAKGGHTARFRLVFSLPAKKADEPAGVAFAEGRIEAVPGSDATSLVSALRTALGANGPALPVTRVRSLSFTAAYIGSDLSLAPGGGFNGKPAGTWIAIKIFVPVGDEMDELFLNLSPETGQGQFSVKDESYGDRLVQLLAGVL